MTIRYLVAITALFGFGLFGGSQLAAQRPAGGVAPRNGVALVDTATIVSKSGTLKKQLDGLKQEYEAKAAELRKEGELGNKLTQELQQLPADSPERKRREQDLMKRRADFELHGKRMSDEIRDSETKVYYSLIRDFQGELDRYARATGTQLILRNDTTPPDLTDQRTILMEINKPVVYARDGEITPVILDGLNRRVAAPPVTGRAPAQNRPVTR